MLATSVMDTPVPPVRIVAWCNTCRRCVSEGTAGQRCPTGDPVCYSILVNRRVMFCPLGGCRENDVVILAPATQPPRYVWRMHLIESHSDVEPCRLVSRVNQVATIMREGWLWPRRGGW